MEYLKVIKYLKQNNIADYTKFSLVNYQGNAIKIDWRYDIPKPDLNAIGVAEDEIAGLKTDADLKNPPLAVFDVAAAIKNLEKRIAALEQK